MDRDILRYERAVAALPAHLRRAALALTPEERAAVEEVRLRTGREMTVLFPQGEHGCGVKVEQKDLEMLCDLASEFSRYAAMETLRQGYLTLQGGCRVGFCGTAVIKEGAAVNLRDISSAAIRIAREKRGIADDLLPQLFQNGVFQSTVILSPPGGGKTTLLRELVRRLSVEGLRIGLADERGEIAAVRQGIPQLDVGPRTDVMDGCPKAEAVLMLLRCMNPQVIAVDEVTAEEDLYAMTAAANCGVSLLATIHAESVAELMRKPLYANLLQTGVFRMAVRLRKEDGIHLREVEELTC